MAYDILQDRFHKVFTCGQERYLGVAPHWSLWDHLGPWVPTIDDLHCPLSMIDAGLTAIDPPY